VAKAISIEIGRAGQAAKTARPPPVLAICRRAGTAERVRIREEIALTLVVKGAYRRFVALITPGTGR